MKIIYQDSVPFLTMGQYLSITQPAVMERIKILWYVANEDEINEIEEEVLTPFQQYLDKFMRQAPKPGRMGD